MAAWNDYEPVGPRLKKKPAQGKERSNTLTSALWESCPACQQLIFKKELQRNLRVCPYCAHHMPLSAQERLASLLDSTGVNLAQDIGGYDWVGFVDSLAYKDRLKQASAKTGLSEALVVHYGKIKNQPVVVAVFDFQFIGGSMGTAVGERFVKAVEYAMLQRCPLLCVASSGGARMQESLYSLMQMSKTAAALGRLAQSGLCYIVVLASPCMGGVSASLATLGDVLIAEPKATIGFTGRRVIEQTMKGQLPTGFQESEFLLEHGAIDIVVDRRSLKELVGRLLKRLSQGVK